MDWTKQSEQMVNNWMNMQKKMWDTFFASVPDVGKSPSQKVWEQTLVAGQELIKNSLTAQAEWLRTWVEYLGTVEGVPTQALESARQFQEMSKRWAETQEQLWGNWFEMLKKFDMSKVSGGWPGAAQDPFQTWQESTQKVMQAQVDWMNTWTKSMGAKKDAP
jgi:hypothetical protein